MNLLSYMITREKMIILTLFLFRLNDARGIKGRAKRFDWGGLFGDKAEVITTSTQATTIGGRGIITESTTQDSFFDSFGSEETSTTSSTTVSTTTTTTTTIKLTTRQNVIENLKTKCKDDFFGNFLNGDGDNVDCVETTTPTTTSTTTTSTTTLTTTSTMYTTTSTIKTSTAQTNKPIIKDESTGIRTDSSDSSFPTKEVFTTTTEKTTTQGPELIGEIDGRETTSSCARDGFKEIYGWCYTKFDNHPHGISARLAFKKCYQFGERFTLLGMSRISKTDQTKIIHKLSERGEITCGGLWTSAISRSTYYNTAGSKLNSYTLINTNGLLNVHNENYAQNAPGACTARLPQYPEFNQYSYLDVFCFKVN